MDDAELKICTISTDPPQPDAMDHPIKDTPDLTTDPRAVLPTVEALLQAGRLEAAEVAMASVIDLVASDFWIGRLHARCAGGAAWALGRWRGQVQRHPDEPQAWIDLAYVLRAMTGRHGEADAVLADAVLRFPRHLQILEEMALAAERRDDFTDAATLWRTLLVFHPKDRRAPPALVAALLRADRLDAALAAADELLDTSPAAAELRATLARRAEDVSDWSSAAFQWRAARLADPTSPHGWLGEARMLERFGGFQDSDHVLSQARAAIPHSVPIAQAWARSAGHLGNAAETLYRAKALHALMPNDPAANRALGFALMASGDPAAASAPLGSARQALPDDFDVAALEVTALMRLHRWQAALEAAADLFNAHRDTPEAGRGLVETLEALGRSDQAEAVLRDLHQRFATARWVLVKLARLTAPDEAGRLWQEAGLPGSGDAPEILAYAATLPAPAALAVLAQAEARLQDVSIPVTRAQILLEAGDVAGAFAVWQRLAQLDPRPQGRFLPLTVALSLAAPHDDADRLLEILLDEADPGHTAWRPALAMALAGWNDIARRLRPRVADLLTRRPERLDSLATAACRNLCTKLPDADTMSLRIARAVTDGRTMVAALLVGARGEAVEARSATMRVALRLYINRDFATADRVAALDPQRLALLFELSRAFDPECLAYLSDITRPVFPPAMIPDLAGWEQVVGAVAHARPAPSAKGRVEGRLRIALCLHGRLDPDDDRAAIEAGLGLFGHEVTAFAHLWPSLPPADQTGIALFQRLPDGLHDAMIRAGLSSGTARDRYPAVFGPGGKGASAHADASVRGFPHSLIEDPASATGRSRGPGGRARAKAWNAHRMAQGAIQAGTQPFDLVIHLRADTPCSLQTTGRLAPDWGALAHAARTGRTVFADQGYHIDPIEGLSVGAGVMIGGMAAMSVAADSFALGEMVASGRATIAGFEPEQTEHGTLGLMLHLSATSIFTHITH